MILKAIRTSKRTIRVIACFMTSNLLLSLAAPMQALALTGGPSQPEVQSFEPVSTNQMVDPFTGDFTYNIPLLDVGGYPINISYHAGPGLDEEASWVGLGWNINPGVINRGMRGVPDDFFAPNPTPSDASNDFIKKTSKMNPSKTISISLSPQLEGFSKKLGEFVTFGIDYNNYRGIGVTRSFGQRGGKFPFSVSFSSQNGISANVNAPYKRIFKKKEKLVTGQGNPDFSETNETDADFLVGSIGLGLNSRQGMTDLSFGVGSREDRVSTTTKDGQTISQATLMEGNVRGYNSSISFLSSTYTPTTANKNYSLSLNVSVELGKEFYGLNPDSRIGISLNQTGVFKKNQTLEYPVYGYMYQALAYNNFEHPGVAPSDKGKAIMDFNSYGTSMLSKSEVQLPYTVSTQDILSVSGQGISGTYQAHSASVGTVYDQTAETFSIPPLSLGFDLAGAATAKLGVDISSSFFWSKSGRWVNSNGLIENMNFTNTRAGADFEQVYFKNAGEKTAVDKDFYNSIDGGLAARPEMDTRLIAKNSNNKGALGIKLKPNLKTWGTDPAITTKIIRQKRDRRNQVITTLTAKDAESFGLIKYKSSVAKDHHIGEITAINPGGIRYVYAQPAYNVFQKSYSFSFDDRKNDSKRNVDINTNIAWFENNDHSIANDLNLEKFFSLEETPAYAHSFLLNAVLSPDYTDITDNGPTPDDNGSYTLIDYKKLKDVYNNPTSYRWRTPFAVPKEFSGTTLYSANHQEGLESDQEDDKASLIYGEKEIFYVNKIETKTHVAFFYTSNREDGIGVVDELGARNDNVRLQKLDSIQLFTTYDYYNYPATRKPLKVVYFEYDYSLCPNVPNNTGFPALDKNSVNLNADKGKLTLTKIFFKYGDSKAGMLSPYVFSYSSNNYGYGYKNYDRWGNYKATHNNPSNHQFPYSEQDKTLADEFASAWSLTTITLPSGGAINVEYEADDYAYVQDKEAMEMFKIIGFGKIDPSSPSTINLSTSNLLYWDNGFKQNDYVFFKLKTQNDNIDKYIPEPSHIDNKRHLYINTKVKLKTDISQQSYYDYVRTYAEIESWGICANDNNYGYIKIKKASLGESIGVSYGKVNPISRNAWQFLRTNTPHLVYEGQDVLRSRGHDGFNLADVFNMAFSIFGYYPELAKTIVGFNTYQLISKNGNSVVLNESWMRLRTPNLNKIGGGLRVKKVLINNSWAGDENQTLGQVYDYTITENERIISSGVASYEPQIGNDENPHRLPSFYVTKKLGSFGAESYYFNDVPLGESIYPSPLIGYRQVKVRNIKPDEDDDVNTTGTITRHGTGYTIQKFYTSYDFPVKATKTTVDADFKKSPILSLLKISQEIVGATQGFSIEINDMHGKPKAMETYDEFDKLITKTEYFYKTDLNNKRSLNNVVTALRSDGTIDREAIIGYEIDMVMHPRQLIEAGLSAQFNSDADVMFIGVAPVITPGFGLNLGGSYKMVRTATATKVVNRFGILERVTVTDQSSSVSTINKAFDEETGEVLLTETTNEFNDQIYNFTYPAHWTYDEGMGSAYKNVGVSFNGVTIASGIANFSASDAQFITEGDEYIANDGSTEIRAWVLDKFDNNGTGGIDYKITFIDRTGASLSDATYTFRNIRSGRRNMQTIPVGTIVGNTNPIPDVGTSFFTNGEVQMDPINASAATFSDKWQTYRHDPGCWTKECTTPPDFERHFNLDHNQPASFHYCFYSALETPPTNFPVFGDAFKPYINPFVLGIKGNWRPNYTYVYYDRGLTTYKREQSNTGTSAFNGTNIAVDGRISDFKPFWLVDNGIWKNRGEGYSGGGNNPWTWNSVANQINPDGIELENKNALGIYSSAIYSYVSKQPLAVTYNAELRETLFEGFEDYPIIDIDVLECQNAGDPPQSYTLLSPSFSSTPINALNETEKTKLITTPFHWYFWPTLHFDDVWAFVSEDEAHTGKKSLEIYGSTIKVPTKVYDKSNNPNNDNTAVINQYQLNNEDLTDIFSPKIADVNSAKTQLLSYWVKATDLSSTSVSIQLQGSPITLTLISESKPIEGWVKREYSFTFSTVNEDDVVDVIITNTDGANSAYFDDIRIHPMTSNMKSFVYDNKTLRLMATLDENNYATFFEYDEEGNLVRTKRETERGIITINENRQNIKH